ncbi:DUF2163 domain-containing protein [Henriciella aquimarina]|uniref:DUF2163 domain-containing protein n=1 Tax=Henriciella aquimarina TaxID=545261 RepID=UPI000A04D95B|nr:DUF2163 domain-containing protein [Henriciella aquimarina]
MKLIDTTFQTRLESEALTSCLCWTLVRADGTIVGVTDHDRPVVWQGTVHAPGAALESGRFQSGAGFSPGRAAAAGALSAEAIREADLAAALWNGARVHVYRVDWAAPAHGVLIWTGYLSEIRQTRAGFEAELVSLKADLERPVGRSYSRRCDAKLGDARCGLTGVAGETCDKRLETCGDVFSNTLNFRGFPHMPGPDFVLAGPAATGNDGGKR